MALGPSIVERLNRARSDLRMGVPVVLADGGRTALVVALEALEAGRLESLRSLGAPELALTARRAETLKLPAYDGDLARLVLPADRGLDWLRAIADPSDDLRLPMKGPFHSLREGPAALHRAALSLVKSAQLLPAALLVIVPDGMALAVRSSVLRALPVKQPG